MSAAAAILTEGLRLGMASWRGGPSRLVAPLPGGDSRVVDLSGVEAARLRRLGEGQPEGLAAALVPPDLGGVLAAGPRGLARVRQALAYAVKWHRRGDLPEALAPLQDQVAFQPCLARPRQVFGWDGRRLEVVVAGPGAVLDSHPQPTLAALGMADGRPGAFCLALPEAGRVILGAWAIVDPPWEGRLLVRLGAHQRSAPLDGWVGLALGPLAPGDLVLLPAPRLRRMPDPQGGGAVVVCPWETLRLRVEGPLDHPLVQ